MWLVFGVQSRASRTGRSAAGVEALDVADGEAASADPEVVGAADADAVAVGAADDGVVCAPPPEQAATRIRTSGIGTQRGRRLDRTCTQRTSEDERAAPGKGR